MKTIDLKGIILSAIKNIIADKYTTEQAKLEALSQIESAAQAAKQQIAYDKAKKDQARAGW